MTDLKSNIVKWVDQGLAMLLSHTAKGRSERVILVVAIASYLVHLSLIFLANQGYIPSRSGFLTNPIAAIYTPFSFILVFEVYMLIFYLPRSTSFYIGKQYEIITLIIIRRIFKDIGNLELQTDWFNNKNDLQFTYDAVTSLPPYPTLGVFIIPVILLLPVKLAVLGLIATGHVILGGVVFIIAKVVGVGIGAFLFETCKPKLLQIPLFARVYTAWMRWVVWAHALTDPIKRRIRARIRLMTRHRPNKTLRIFRLVQRIRRVRARPA